MATITTRSGKGSPLTNTEVDNNFTNLNTAKYESGDSINVSGFNFTAANPSLNITANTDNWAAVNIQAGDTQANYVFFRDADAERARMTVLNNNDFSFSTGSNVERLKLSATAAVFNEPGNDVDFRIESDVDTAAFFVNGENSKVGIRNTNPSYLLDVSGSSSFPNGIRFIQSLQDITDGNDHRGVKVTHNRYEQSGGTMNATGTHIGYDYDLNTGGSANATISGDTYGVRVIRSMGSGGNTTGTNFGYFYNSATYGSSNGATYAFYVGNVKPDGGSGSRFAFYNADQSATSTFEGTNVFNESSNATDFRVESNGNSHMLYVEGATDRVAIGHNDPAGILDVYKAYSNSETPKGLVLRDNTTTSNVALPGIWWSHSGDRYRAAIRAENDGPYGRKSISFWTSSTASWTASESDMKMRAIVKDHGDFELITQTDNSTNSQALPGKLRFRGRGWNTTQGTEDFNISMEMAGAYSSSKGQTDPEFKLNVTTTDASNRRNDSTVFHIYPTDNNAANYTGNFYNGLIVNDLSTPAGDFRVESDSDANMLFVDASTNRVGIKNGGPISPLHINAGVSAAMHIDTQYAGGSGGNTAYSNPGVVNNLLNLRTGYAENAETNPNDGMLWGIRFTGYNGSAGSLTGKTAAVYARSEDTGAGYNRKVGLEFQTSAFDASAATATRITSIKELIHYGSGIFNENGGNYDFRVETDDYSHALFVDGSDNSVKIGTTENSGPAGNGNARLVVGNGIEITQSLTQNSTDKTMLRLSNGGSWSNSGNAGYYSDIVWDNGGTQTMGKFGLRYANTTSGGQSEVTLRDMYQGGFGASGEVVNFGSNRFSVFHGGMTINDDSLDQDFRVESDGNSNMLKVDAGNNRVGVGVAPDDTFHVDGQFKLNGFQYQAVSAQRSGISLSGNEWVTIAYIPYGEVLAEIGIEWNGLSAPGSAHHGYMKLRVGGYYNSYYYGWESSLELIDKLMHNTFHFTEARIVRPDNYSNQDQLWVQVRASQAVSTGTMKAWVERTVGPNGTYVSAVQPTGDNSPDGNTEQAHIYFTSTATKRALYGNFDATGSVIGRGGLTTSGINPLNLRDGIVKQRGFYFNNVSNGTWYDTGINASSGQYNHAMGMAVVCFSNNDGDGANLWGLKGSQSTSSYLGGADGNTWSNIYGSSTVEARWNTSFNLEVRVNSGSAGGTSSDVLHGWLLQSNP